MRAKDNLIYLIIWVLILIGCTIHLSYERVAHTQTMSLGLDFLHALKGLLPLFALFLINNFLLIPKFIKTHKILIYNLCVIALLVVYGIFQYSEVTSHHHEFLYESMQEFQVHSNRPRHPEPLIPMPFVHSMCNAILVIGINLAIYLFGRYIRLNMEKNELEAANTRNQLDHLKGQINPHFYMNMLNSIHGLIEINPPKAQELVIGMSHLMQYMLYDSSKDYISLSDELNFVKEYVRIIQDRFPKGKVNVSFKLPDNKDVTHIKIPPLLFLVFIENAFKHGVDYRYESNIMICIDVRDNELHFTCMNRKFPLNEGRIKHHGIGLENVRKRLELLYQGKETLDIEESDERYIVNLIIPIHETEDNNN